MALIKNPRKRILLVIAAALLIGAGWSMFGHSSPAADKKQRTVTVETGTIEEVVTAQGKLEPKNYVDVGLQVSGQIKKLHVDIGDAVKKNALLAEIDPRIYQSKLESDEAQLHSLQAQAEEQRATLQLAQQQQRRNATMLKTHVVSKDAFDQGQAALLGAQAKLKSLLAQTDVVRSTLKADHTNLEYTKIYAPMDGTVATLPVREGQTINAVQSAPTIMQITNLDVMTVRAQVAEADVMRITQGMDVYFTKLGDMDKRFTGTVRQIQPTPEIINDVVLYDVLIDADNKDRALMNGMSTQVFFVLGKAENVPVLPLEALGKRQPKDDNDMGKAYSVRLVGGKDSVTIHAGISDRTRSEIRDGLKAGDQVILPTREKPAGNGNRSGGGMPPGMGGPKL